MASIRESKVAPISVAVVNYNTPEHLRLCLETILPETPREIIVVDNASTDGSADMVRTQFPQVTLYVNSSNEGYGAAANQAIARSTAKYVLLLNSDTRLQAGALEVLSKYLDQQPHAAIVGPRLINPDGTLQASCFPFPTPLHMLIEESTLGRRIGSIPLLRNSYLRTWSHTHARVVPWVMGAALAIRREAFEAVGGFDASFFIYFEEVDLCYRLKNAGWQVHFNPGATIIHLGGASTEQIRVKMMIQLFASTRQFYQRHYSKIRVLELTVLVKSLIWIKLIRDSLRLHLTREACRRANIAEAISIWQGVLQNYSFR